MGWKKVKINEVGFVQGGYAFASTEYKEVGVPLIRISNIYGDEIEVNSNTVFVDENYLNTKKDFLVTKGDVLIAMSGATTGKFGVYKLKIPSLLNQRVGRIKLNNNTIDRKYFYYFMFQIQKLILRNSYGAAIPNISPTDIASLQIPLPPLSTQQRIAAILDKADELRRKDKALLAQYDSMLQSIFYNMFGDPVKNEKRWEKKKFGDVYKSIRYGTSTPPNYQASGIPFIRATNIKNGYIVNKGMVYLNDKDSQKIKKCFIKEGNIILVRSGINTGDCARVDNKYDGSLAGYDLIIEIEEPHSTFYSYLINSSYGKKIIKPISRRAAQPHLNAEQTANLEFYFPPTELQKKFSVVFQNINQQKQQIKQQIKQSENLFQSLLQKAFREELISGE